MKKVCNPHGAVFFRRVCGFVFAEIDQPQAGGRRNRKPLSQKFAMSCDSLRVLGFFGEVHGFAGIANHVVKLARDDALVRLSPLNVAPAIGAHRMAKQRAGFAGAAREHLKNRGSPVRSGLIDQRNEAHALQMRGLFQTSEVAQRRVNTFGLRASAASIGKSESAIARAESKIRTGSFMT